MGRSRSAMAEEPKRPQNAYWLFLSDHRAAFEKEAGSKSGPAVGKLAGQKWKALEAAKKKPYEENAERLKKEYQAALEKFKADGGVAGKRRAEKAAGKKEKDGGKRARKERDPNKPKKPMTGYWLWLGENRAALTKELGTGKGSEVAKLGGEKWRALPEKEKAPIEKKAAALKAEYDKAMVEYKKTAGNDGDDDDDGEEEN